MQHDRYELTDEARKTYAAARRVAVIVVEHYSPHVGSQDKPWAQDRRWGRLNPASSQTRQGLFLEFHYATPNRLWTPWGKWIFVGACVAPGEVAVWETMSHFTTRLHVEERFTARGVVGPVFALLAVDGEALPEPTLITDRGQYLESKAAREMWARLTADWWQTRASRRPPS